MSSEHDKDGMKLFETKQGLVSVPVSQQPQPLQDFFANDRLPAALSRFDVYQTEAGPVLERRAQVAWTSDHDRKLEEIAAAAKARIEADGYHLRSTTRHIKALVHGTNKPLQQAFDEFHATFKETYGQSTKEMVDAWRIGRNLPVRARRAEQEPEM